jgi:hypothetical protein
VRQDYLFFLFKIHDGIEGMGTLKRFEFISAAGLHEKAMSECWVQLMD